MGVTYTRVCNTCCDAEDLFSQGAPLTSKSSGHCALCREVCVGWWVEKTAALRGILRTKEQQ